MQAVYSDELRASRSNRRSHRIGVDLSSSNLIQVLDSFYTYKSNRSSTQNVAFVKNYIDILACGNPFYPEDVDDIFYDEFIDLLMSNNLKTSTIENYARTLIAALEWGCKHGARVSSSYRDFSIKTNNPRTISLTSDDVSFIAHFDVRTIKCRPQLRKTYKKIRDAFVLQCNLFQRHSDMIRISKENFNGHIFTCVQQKTGNKSRVDIDRYSVTPKLAYEILQEYDYEFPYKGTINNYNAYLHKLLQSIGGGFLEDVMFEERINGEVKKVFIPKWKLCTSHTARRTAITLAVQRSSTESEVRRCSGHFNRHDSFQTYIKYND